jgi:uncharacterized membrane protein YbhN (UPF0104 family)
MKRAVWRWTQLLGAAAVLGALAWRLGLRPFVDGIAMVDAPALLAATLITLFTTACCAWRWRLVARGLGVELPLGAAIAAYYRSQFVNSVLPGGVLGDVHRGADHGRQSGDVARGLRAVAWERGGGQVVQIVLALILLAVLPSPVRAAMPLLAGITVIVVVLAVVVLRSLPTAGASFWVRTIRASAVEFRRGLMAWQAWPGVVLTSCAVTAGHAAVFLIAARTAGLEVPPTRVLPLALLVLLAMSIPMNIAGWGPREGVAAWAFSAAGLAADQGVTVAVVYGALAFVACLPGVAVLVIGGFRRRQRMRGAESARFRRRAVVGSAAHG